MIEIAFREERLANGLRFVLAEDHTAPIVAANLWYGVGSANEVAGLTGLAHLFEHMMFEGSADVAPGEHARVMTEAGGSWNGMTTHDATIYFETVPAEYLEVVLWMESNRMGRLTDALAQEKLDNQRMVVKNEKRQRIDNQPYGAAMPLLSSLLFPEGHPYHHDPIGSMEDLDAASLDDVRDFFGTWYAPDNCVITLAGDIDPDETATLMERHFGHRVPRGSFPERPSREPLAMLGGERRETITDGRVPVPAVYIGYRLPPDPGPQLDALQIASWALSAGRHPRLTRRLVRREQLAQRAGFGLDTRVGGASLGIASATARHGVEIAAVEAALLEEIEKLGEDGPTDDEVERARTQLERRVLESLSRASARASELSRYAMLFDDPAFLVKDLENLFAVTPDDVRGACRDLLREDNRAVVTVVPAA